MEKGFYTKPDVDEALENLFFNANSDICGEMFLHGVCGIFALALHDTYGYNIGWILDDEEDDEEDDCIPWNLDDKISNKSESCYNPWYHLVHIFCYHENSKENTVFVDIRGCQTDKSKFEEGFEDFFVEPNYEFDLSYDDLKDKICETMSKETFKEYYDAAIYFIKEGKDIYKI